MGSYEATIHWESEGDFERGKYSRAHSWTFDGGLSIPASASPHVVRPPLSNPAGIDPEEALVASVSSCHMLTFVHLARKAGHVVLRYDDHAVGTMTKNERGVPWVSRIELRPRVAYAEGRAPSREEEGALHHAAHEECFIAQSIKSEVVVLAS
jgi:organic hydroperoxide reductase OsmC/OhrA